jgi:two-component system, LytTR family, response regulator
MLRAIIVDDVESIRTKNKALIEQHCPTIRFLAEATSVKTAIEAINKFLPDIIFLDVELQDGTGFDVLKQLENITFKVIFITAFQEFAINAFRVSAIDYLQKPLNPIHLIEAVNKAQEAISKEVLDLKMNTLLVNTEQPNVLKKIVLKTSDKIFSINIQDIIRCESDKNYTTFYLLNSAPLIVSNTLKEYERMLENMNFYRSHRSHLINLAFFDYYKKTDGGSIILKDKSEVPLAPHKKDELFELIEKM